MITKVISVVVILFFQTAALAASIAECTNDSNEIQASISPLSDTYGTTHLVVIKRSGQADTYIRSHQVSLNRDLALNGGIGPGAYLPLQIIFHNYAREKRHYENVSFVIKQTGYDPQAKRPTVVTNELNLRCEVTTPFNYKNICSGKSRSEINQMLLTSAKFSNADLFDQAISCGAEVNYQDNSGCTPLLSALESPNEVCKRNSNPPDSGVFGRQEYIANKLIDLGAYYDVTDNLQGQSALHRAVGFWNNGYNNILELLIALDADLNLQDKNGHTPLMLAAKNGLRLSVESLIEASADLTFKDVNGKTAYDLGVTLNSSTRDKLLATSKELIIEGQNNGTCSPLAIEITKGERVKLTIKAASNNMFMLTASAFGVNLMAGAGQSASKVIEAKASGSFGFECGVHGGKQSKGKITVK